MSDVFFPASFHMPDMRYPLNYPYTPEGQQLLFRHQEAQVRMSQKQRHAYENLCLEHRHTHENLCLEQHLELARFISTNQGS